MGLTSLCVAVSHPQMNYCNNVARLTVLNTTKNTATSFSSSSSSSGGRLLAALPGSDNPREFLEQKAKDLAKNHQIMRANRRREKNKKPLNLELVRIDGVPDAKLLDLAYERCRRLFLSVEDPHIVGIRSLSERMLLGEEKAKAIWAVWAFGRRIDEFVDGMNGSCTTADDVLRFEERTIDAMNGRPWNIYDLALFDTISNFPVDPQLFLDLIEGTRSDITRKIFVNYEEICLYRYYISSSVLLMFVQVCGFSADSKVDLQTLYKLAITYGFGLAEIDCYRDIADDASMGRINFPQDELALAGITNKDVITGRVTPMWTKFMEDQMKRTKMLMGDGEKMLSEIDHDGRWWLWTGGLGYLQDLSAIEPGDYELTQKNLAAFKKTKRLWAMVEAYVKSRGFI